MKRLFPVICVFSCLIAAHSFAGSATWNLNPTSGDWNTATNWTPNTVPNGPADVATFAISNQTSVTLVDEYVHLDRIVFDTNASPFTLTCMPFAHFEMEGAGQINNSGVDQTFVTESIAGMLGAGAVDFYNNASAGDSSITYINGTGDGESPCFMDFFGSATAGSATFMNEHVEMDFSDNSSAGTGTFINSGRSTITFGDSSTADHGIFVCNSGGLIFFINNCTAGNGIFTINSGGVLEFLIGTESAGSGTFIINAGMASGAQGGFVTLINAAENANFTVNGAALSDADAGTLSIGETATLDNAVVVANGGSGGGPGGLVAVYQQADGGNAQFKLFGNGTLDISQHNPPPFVTGSIEGDGIVSLGSNTLTLGRNGLDTVFSGVIQGNSSNGAVESLRKIGRGTLTLSGANTYPGTTTVKDGNLLVKNTTGSGTGTGALQVSGGILGGRGIIAGATTIGTGSSTGGTLQPGKGASTPSTITLQNTLTFKSDGTYSWKLNTKKAKADQVIANGVAIQTGAQFDLNTVGNKKLTAGKVFTAVSNTAVTPISGTFSNLADGSTVTIGVNKLQVSYAGGDGNDLTLTVIP